MSWQRAALRRVGWTTLLLVVGFVLGVIGGGSWVSVTGWTLVGLALIVYVALAFLEVGLSEDRDRSSGRQ